MTYGTSSASATELVRSEAAPARIGLPASPFPESVSAPEGPEPGGAVGPATPKRHLAALHRKEVRALKDRDDLVDVLDAVPLASTPSPAPARNP